MNNEKQLNFLFVHICFLLQGVQALQGAVQILGELFKIQRLQKIIGNTVMYGSFRIFEFTVAADDNGENAGIAFINMPG